MTNVGGAAWDEDYNLTSSYNSFSTTALSYNFDFIASPGACPDKVAYAKYRITIDGSYSTYVDYRDSDYFGVDYDDYFSPDLWVIFNWSTKTFTRTPSSGKIWDLRYHPANRSVDEFKVPLLVQNQDIAGGGNVKINSVSYSSPKTYYASWQSENNIEGPDQLYEGLEWDFTQWTDSNTDNPRLIGIGSSGYCLTSYAYTARHTKTVPCPGLFNIGVNGDHPILSWQAQTGDYIGGYYMYRNYDEEGWEKVETITDKYTDDWTDTEVYYQPGADPVSYKMKTYDYVNDESDYTIARAVKGYMYAETMDDPSTEMKPDFSLRQNQPNPFNPSTVIAYSLGSESEVSLSVYNILGKKIRTLVSEQKSQGVYTVIWDSKDEYGRDVSAGIYVYQIVAAPLSDENVKLFVASGKMQLIK